VVKRGSPARKRGSVAPMTISSFSNELIVTHYSKFFKKNEPEKFTALAANS
jgi:hypothetical protein